MPESIQIPISLLKDNNKKSVTGQVFTVIPSTNVSYTPVSINSDIFILSNSQLTSQVNFIKAVQKDNANSNLPASSTFSYSNNLTATSTGSITALYELVRGYLYRDASYTAYPSIPTLITSKTSNSTITGFRFVTFNNSIKAEKIKPGTFRLSITPNNITSTTPYGLRLSNSGVTDDTSSGQYAAIINDWSTSGSLINGVSGSVLTAFTILFKIKPTISGPTTQTLFHRRVADKSSTSLGVGSKRIDVNNAINYYHYGLLGPSYLECSASAIVNGSATSWGCTGTDYPAGLLFYGSDTYPNDLNYIGLTAFFNPATNKFTPVSGSVTSASTAAVIKITNVGGGLVRVGYQEDVQTSGYSVNKSFITVSTGNSVYYQLSTNAITSEINAINYLDSYTATITCSVDFNSNVSNSESPTTSVTQYTYSTATQTYIWNLKIFEGYQFKQSYKDSLNKFINIPIQLTVIPMFNPAA